jgi:hypothetical protein
MERILQGGLTLQSISPVAWCAGTRWFGDMGWWIEMEIVNSVIFFFFFPFGLKVYHVASQDLLVIHIRIYSILNELFLLLGEKGKSKSRGKDRA